MSVPVLKYRKVKMVNAMRINFYETILSEDDRVMIIKEKAVNYEAGKMNNPQDITLMMRRLLHMEHKAEEYCYMVALNSSCRVLGIFFISKGTVNASLITPREFYIRALLSGAVSIVLCHNHPSGDISPSKEDVMITRKLREAGELLCINFADHIIIGKDGYFSFAEEKML